MGKIIVITSGKGGVGKTTTSAALATGLALRGHKTVVIDFDVGLSNLDLVMGCERQIVFDLINVINKEASLSQALIKDKHTDNLFVLAAAQTRDKDSLTKEGIQGILEELQQDFDYIVCDSPAGIEKGALHAMYFADCAIVVTNPDIFAVRDANRILAILASKTRRGEMNLEPVAQYLVINRYSPERVKRGDMLNVSDVQDILAIPLLGVIPESQSVLKAANLGFPIILDTASEAGIAFANIVAKFLGDPITLHIHDRKKQHRIKHVLNTLRKFINYRVNIV